MALTEDEVVQILKMVEQSNFGELRLETGDLKLLVRKKGYIAPCAEFASAPVSSGPAATGLEQPVIRDPAVPGAAHKPDNAADDHKGAIAIKSPMLGTVYLRPGPDAPPYVEVGSYVKKEETICLIEVMKVFTAVKAESTGYITAVLVETNQMVEYGQTLFLIKPEAESHGKNG